MRLKSEKVLELMMQIGITEDMLPSICGVHYVRDDCLISDYHARRLARILGVEITVITEDLG